MIWFMGMILKAHELIYFGNTPRTLFINQLCRLFIIQIITSAISQRVLISIFIPLGEQVVKWQYGGFLDDSSDRMIPKLYISPFFVPFNGGFESRSNSGEVQYKSEMGKNMHNKTHNLINHGNLQCSTLHFCMNKFTFGSSGAK